MRYHNITKDDMLNGDGLRVVLWVAGCNHCCRECQNPITWDPNGGLPFTEKEENEIFSELEKNYVWHYIFRWRSFTSGKYFSSYTSCKENTCKISHQDYLALYGIFLGRDSERRDRGLSGCLCRWRICCFSQRCRIEMARFLQPESN